MHVVQLRIVWGAVPKHGVSFPIIKVAVDLVLRHCNHFFAKTWVNPTSMSRLHPSLVLGGHGVDIDTRDPTDARCFFRLHTYRQKLCQGRNLRFWKLDSLTLQPSPKNRRSQCQGRIGAHLLPSCYARILSPKMCMHPCNAASPCISHCSTPIPSSMVATLHASPCAAGVRQESYPHLPMYTSSVLCA
jgi:hypothetical protein